MITNGERYPGMADAALAAIAAGPNWKVSKTDYACDPWVIMKDPEVGDYLNHLGYSDVNPYKIVEITKSGKTCYVQEVEAERDPNWKPNFVPGGFSAHCTNNHDQKWVYGKLLPGRMAVRKVKVGWKSAYGRHSLSSNPLKHYDYNF